ncbi:IclR family transcriptional regulator [Actinomadura sp. 3N407]|uniref:IclR family transcriptional regulator n=1 Tax=Actinomadura sp. 3N407 TaxID=3457423 RepID=UPI003FCDA314
MPYTTDDEIEDEAAGPRPSVLAKTHQLLAAFTYETATLGLTELSRRSGVPKATTHRLAVELVELGYLTRTPKGYQLGWRIFELGQLVPGPANLRGVARPALMDLHAAMKAAIHLAVPQGFDCVYLERLVGRREMRVVTAVDTRVPSWFTASGRLFLAHGDPQALTHLDREALTTLGVGHHSELRAPFARIREQRYSEERQQCLTGFKTLSVPVTHGSSDRVVAAVSVTRPMERKDDQQVLHALWATAGDISRRLPAATGASRAGPTSRRAQIAV